MVKYDMTAHHCFLTTQSNEWCTLQESLSPSNLHKQSTANMGWLEGIGWWLRVLPCWGVQDWTNSSYVNEVWVTGHLQGQDTCQWNSPVVFGSQRSTPSNWAYVGCVWRYICTSFASLTHLFWLLSNQNPPVAICLTMLWCAKVLQLSLLGAWWLLWMQDRWNIWLNDS